MNFDEWVSTMPSEMSMDALWQMMVYRQALFAGELAWHDATKLAADSRTLKLAAQLYDAVGGISATIAEGYSRGSERDQARFYEYALGSAREARDWYYKGRYVLGSAVFEHRTKLLVHIIRQLLKLIPAHRGRTLSEPEATYDVSRFLFAHVPMPDDE